METMPTNQKGKMSDKPTGEWTAEFLDEFFDLKFERGPVTLSCSDWFIRLSALADKHNAALAAEREKAYKQGHDDIFDGMDNENQQLREQLAAAKQEGIDWADKQYYGASGQQRIRELEQQLSAERERSKSWEQDALRYAQDTSHCKSKVQTLVDALEKISHAYRKKDIIAIYETIEEGEDALAKVKERR